MYPDAQLVFDETKPDGTPRKVLDVSKLRNLGWSPTIDLESGIATTYEWFMAQQASSGALRGLESVPVATA